MNEVKGAVKKLLLLRNDYNENIGRKECAAKLRGYYCFESEIVENNITHSTRLITSDMLREASLQEILDVLKRRKAVQAEVLDLTTEIPADAIITK